MHLRIDVSHAVRLLGAAVLLGSAACGGAGGGTVARTTAASQPSPAAFDPAQSDAQALAVIDATIAAAGGAAAWEQVKQIQWESKYHQNDAFAGWFKHAWDRWNGKHRWETTDLAEYKKAEEAGRLQDVKWVVAMYDLFDRQDRPAATYGGILVAEADRDRLVGEAYQRWQADSYLLALPHKLKDPGVILAYVGEAQEANGKCQGGCVVVKLSFVPELGGDVYFLNINKGTNLPDVIEKQTTAGTLAYAVDAWAEAGGLKFPAKLRNLGASEVISFENIRVGEPDDSLYRAPVQR